MTSRKPYGLWHPITIASQSHLMDEPMMQRHALTLSVILNGREVFVVIQNLAYLSKVGMAIP